MRQEDIWVLTGREGYEYDALCDLDDDKVRSYTAGVRQQFAEMAKTWSDERNTEWISRHYLALKYILAAQMKVSATEYATQQNLLIVVPYLHYYLLFHCCRAFLLTRPNEQMEIATAGHKKIINCTTAAIGGLSGQLKRELLRLLSRSQSLRELFSYRFPATGLNITRNRVSSEDVFLWARRLAELAELNSECLASAVERNCSQGVFGVDWHRLIDLCGYTTPEYELDEDDLRRLRYLSKQKLPYELMCVAREGLTEDFYGAWAADEEQGLPEHAFDPYHAPGPSIFSHW